MPVIKTDHKMGDEVITINIEVDKVPDENVEGEWNYGNQRGPGDKIVSVAQDMFNDGLQLARNCATAAVTGLKEMNQTVCPDEFGINISIKLDSQFGAVLAKIGSEAQMQVSMKWTRKVQKEQAENGQ